jgi:hypothetical protein
MHSISSNSRQESVHHSILSEPWTYKIVGLTFQCDPADADVSVLKLSLRKKGELVHLRFTGVHQLQIEARSFPWCTSGLQILDATASGMERARVRVSSFEQDDPISFWASNVERVRD